MLTILLFLSLFALFYLLTGGILPETRTGKDYIMRYGSSIIGAGLFFIAGTVIFLTPLSGLLWAVLGWFVPGWVMGKVQQTKQARLMELAKSFITTATGLFAARQTTFDVIEVASRRFPEPFAGEFQNMLAQRKLNQYFSIPSAFEGMAAKYNLPELKAAGAILEASEHAGGPVAAAKGFKRLNHALKQRDKLIQERTKATMEPKIAAGVTIVLLGLGIIADATVWRDLYSQGAGKIVLALSSGLLVGMILMTNKITRSQDIA